MEVKIGIQSVPRELVVETDTAADEIAIEVNIRFARFGQLAHDERSDLVCEIAFDLREAIVKRGELRYAGGVHRNGVRCSGRPSLIDRRWGTLCAH